MRTLLKGLHALEDLLLAVLLTGMILLASAQIFLRNFFDSGITWAEPSLKALVLWLGLLGALAATRGGQHINVDILSHWLSFRPRKALQVFTSLFAAAVAGIIAWHARILVQYALEDGTTHASGLPEWFVQIIIPIGFGLIALRFVIFAGVCAADAVRGKPPEAPATLKEASA